MKSRKWIGIVLLTLIIVAILGAGGYALYRYGYSRGVLASHMGEGFMFHDFDDMPFRGGRFGEWPRNQLEDLPHRFEGRFDAPIQNYDPRMSPFGGWLTSRTVFSPFSIFLRVLFLGVVIWVIYKVITLFTGSRSWQLSFNAQSEEDTETEEKPKGRSGSK
jgi:hypothetical protein